jgi:hypothetical protein
MLDYMICQADFPGLSETPGRLRNHLTERFKEEAPWVHKVRQAKAI